MKRGMISLMTLALAAGMAMAADNTAKVPVKTVAQPAPAGGASTAKSTDAKSTDSKKHKKGKKHTTKATDAKAVKPATAPAPAPVKK